MSYAAAICLPFLLCSVLVNIVLALACLRRRRLTSLLQQKLRLRDERMAKHFTRRADISSDWVLVREEGATPLALSPVMQTWLLQPRRMLLLTPQDDVWVAVNRAGSAVAVRGQVTGARVAAWGRSYNVACDMFVRAAYHVDQTYTSRCH